MTRENFFGDRKNVAARFVRKTIIENADFVRPFGITLHQQRRVRLFQIVDGLGFVADEFDADAALAHVRF